LNFFRKVTVTFEFSKQIFHWNNLNRKNYLKFAQKTEQNSIKTSSIKNNSKTVWPEAFCGPPPSLRSMRQLTAAALSCGPAGRGPRPVPAATAQRWPSDEIRWLSVTLAGTKPAPYLSG
jgi:hypothetical protein